MEAFGTRVMCDIFAPFALVQSTRRVDQSAVLRTLDTVLSALGGPLGVRHVALPLAQQLNRVADTAAPLVVQNVLETFLHVSRRLALNLYFTFVFRLLWRF